ncbi:MAG: O-succinylhomoserine sulfhydrylase [Pseudomonadota bacterium]
MAKTTQGHNAQAKWRPATQMVHAGATRSAFGETSEALYLTQGFVYDSAEQAAARFSGDEPGYVYSRYANPTVAMFEGRLATLEGAEACLGTASGMSAVTAAIMSQLRAGDHIVAARALFGSCRWVVEKLAPRYGIECTLVDGRDLDAWRGAMRANTRICFLESPTNPTLELVDIAAVADIAHNGGAKLVVDNVFATPMFQRPLDLGADVVVYSATKHIDGQGRCLGGAILGSQDWVDEVLWDYYRHTGPSLSPFNAWVLLKGLETLPVRVNQQAASAARIADYLAESQTCLRVIYPGRDDHPQAEIAKKQMAKGSTLVAFELRGGKEAAFRFENALRLVQLSNNLGDAKSLITHPATTTHKNLSDGDRAALGISDGVLRLSVGLEDVEDLLSDISDALIAVHGMTTN